MPKTYIKKSAGWTEIKSIFVKKTLGWSEARIVFLKRATGWVKVFQKLSLPDTTTPPSIRTTNTGSGTIYDGPVASSPQYLNEDLFGKDGLYTNYTSISGRKFTYGDTASSTTRTTIVNDDRFTSAGGVTAADRLTVDEKYLFYELTVSNGVGYEIYPVSTGIKMIKQAPYSNSFTITGPIEIGSTLTANLNIEYYYYSRPELSSSYIKWYVGNYAGDTSGTPVQSSTLSSLTYTTSSSQYLATDTLYVSSAYSGKYITALIYGENSWTRHNAFATATYSLDYAYAGDGNPVTSALSITNGRIEDFYNNSGLDNRGDFPVGSSQAIKATISGVDSSTTYRVRYRVYGWQTGLYYNIETGASGTASSVWTTFSADGTGSGNISDVTISGSDAYLTDYLQVNESLFDGGTYGGGLYKWEIHIEISAIKTGGTRTYWINPYQSFYLGRSSNSTISASPSNIGPGSSTTISGSFSGYPAGNAYPRQYRINFGDGQNSGWLPSGGYSSGTSNPSYSVSHTYSSNGTYFPTIETIPYYTANAATVTVAPILTAPTITSVSTSTTGGAVTAYFSGGSGPYYQIYWAAVGPTLPSQTYSPDGSGSSSPITDPSGPTTTATHYMYVRSVASLAETSVGPSSLASAWSSGFAFNMSAPVYTITWNNNDGTGTTSTSTFTSGGYVFAPTPTRTNYTLNGFYDTPAVDYTYFVSPGGIWYPPDGNRTMYARWTYSPPNLTAPSIFYVASGYSGDPITVYFSGGSGPYYQIWWQSSNNFSTVTSYDASGSSSPLTDPSGPAGTGTFYVAVRSVSSPGNNGSGPSTSISAWSSPYAFNVASIPPPSGTAPSTPSGLNNSYASGPTWTGSWSPSSGTAPITYYWTLYQASTEFGAINATASGSTTGTSFTQSMQAYNGLWAYFTVFANNTYGNSPGSGTSAWA